MDDNKYELFFEQIKSFKEKQTKQKQRGLNNYNILTSVLEPHDEVRLHSRMIYSFLNSSGEHFQDTLFLEKFLEVLGIENFFNLSQYTIYKEYENIDLYITDGEKHIILENKVYADDQPEQIKRYIEIIQKGNENIKADDILVVYLTLYGGKPSKKSLDNLVIDDNFIKNDNTNVTKYKSISYKKDIITWLEKCQYEVQNITNLNEAIGQYKDVVKILTNQYEEKIMKLADHITKDIDSYKIAFEIEKELPAIKKNIVDKFIQEVMNDLKKELGNNWIIKLDGDLSKRWEFPLRIYKKSWLNEEKNYLIFGFEFDKYNYKNGYFGIVRISENVHMENDVINKFPDRLSNLNSSLWWLHHEQLPKEEEFSSFVVFTENSEKIFVDRIVKFIKIFEDNGLMSDINKHLAK